MSFFPEVPPDRNPNKPESPASLLIFFLSPAIIILSEEKWLKKFRKIWEGH
jgi:hypothetical protein